MEDRISWPQRAPLLATIGAITGLCYNALVRIGPFRWTDDPARLALGALLLGVAVPFAFVAERSRIAWATGFALAAGVVVGLVTWWTGGLDGGLENEPWHLVCALLAVAIAAPLFQVARDEDAWRFPYRMVHGHAWTNVVLWFAAWAFVLITFLLLYLLGSLFDLIGIKTLSTLLDKDWFCALVVGASFGGAIGLLRDHGRVVVTLQRVVTAVSSVLAPVLAIGLILFLLATPFKGIGLLWQATKYTTPILLACVAWSLILANAVLGDGADDEPRSPLLRWGAMGLGVAMLPLALIAAVSTAKRIHQYGLTPDRLWAVTFVVITTAYGLAYLVALIRRRQNWGEDVRPANLKLAFAVCAVALILATPLAGFGGFSARDQMARIRDGRTPPERIDFRALAFDMGKAGRNALKSLSQSGTTVDVRTKATKALAAKGRWDVDDIRTHADPKLLAAKAQILPVGTAVPPQFWDAVPPFNACHDIESDRRCVIRLWQDRGIAVLVTDGCYKGDCPPGTTILYRQADGSWGNQRVEVDGNPIPGPTKAEIDLQWAAIRRGEIEIRPVARDQLFVGGRQTDDAIDPPITFTTPAKH